MRMMSQSVTELLTEWLNDKLQYLLAWLFATNNPNLNHVAIVCKETCFFYNYQELTITYFPIFKSNHFTLFCTELNPSMRINIIVNILDNVQNKNDVKTCYWLHCGYCKSCYSRKKKHSYLTILFHFLLIIIFHKIV